MELTITMTVGNDTEGIKLNPQLVAAIWPGASDAAVAAGSRDSMKLQLFMQYITRNPTASYQAAQNFINQHSTDTH